MIESFGEGPAVSGAKPIVLWSGVPNKGGRGGMEISGCNINRERGTSKY